MNNLEYEQKKCECWEEFRTHAVCGTDNPKGWFERAFDRAYALGKQEIKQETKQETVIQGWVARDEDGSLTLFYGSDKPSKKDNDDYWSAVFGNTLEYLPQEMFPDVKWEDVEPTQIELIIKRKKNG